MTRKYTFTRFINRLFASPERMIMTLVILAGILVLALEATNTTHFFHKQKAVSGTIKTISSPPSAAAASTTQTNNTVKNPSGYSAGPKTSSPGAGTSSSTLTAPYGTFISNHYPGQNGTLTKEQSTCNTTPGASCYIRFTQGSVTRTLPTQTTNNNGSTSWLWDIGKAGLTSGSWQVSAVATLNGKTSTTTDPVALEIQ